MTKVAARPPQSSTITSGHQGCTRAGKILEQVAAKKKERVAERSMGFKNLGEILREMLRRAGLSMDGPPTEQAGKAAAASAGPTAVGGGR
jgi:hypothetical protein